LILEEEELIHEKKKKKKKKRKKENLPSLQMDRNEPHFDLMNFSFYVK